MSVWIGEIQWMRRNGFAEARDPILKPLDTIECRDAIVTADNTEPEWPAADVVIGLATLLLLNAGIDDVQSTIRDLRADMQADILRADIRELRAARGSDAHRARPGIAGSAVPDGSSSSLTRRGARDSAKRRPSRKSGGRVVANVLDGVPVRSTGLFAGGGGILRQGYSR